MTPTTQQLPLCPAPRQAPAASSIRSLALALSLGLAGLLGAGSAQAQASTGSLVGWAVLGDAVSVDGAITVTTAFLDGGSDEPFNLSGQSAVDVNLIEPAAGLPFFALDLNAENFATEGSVVSQSFSVQPGDTLSFDWRFSSVEDFFLDHAFAAINGQLYTLATTATPGGALQSFSLTFSGAGLASLALGVVDTGDFNGVSRLSISNLVLTPVPEPGTVALMLLGLAGVSGAARLRMRQVPSRH